MMTVFFTDQYHTMFAIFFTEGVKTELEEAATE